LSRPQGRFGLGWGGRAPNGRKALIGAGDRFPGATAEAERDPAWAGSHSSLAERSSPAAGVPSKCGAAGIAGKPGGIFTGGPPTDEIIAKKGSEPVV
jgi:hypothetical protein